MQVFIVLCPRNQDRWNIQETFHQIEKCVQTTESSALETQADIIQVLDTSNGTWKPHADSGHVVANQRLSSDRGDHLSSASGMVAGFGGSRWCTVIQAFHSSGD